MTQYLQNGLKDFKNILHTYSLWYKDVLRQFWFQSEKIDVFSNFFHVLKVHQNLNLKPLWGGSTPNVTNGGDIIIVHIYRDKLWA